MTDKDRKHQPKFNKQKDPQTEGGDGLSEYISNDAETLKKQKAKKEQEQEEKQRDNE